MWAFHFLSVRTGAFSIRLEKPCVTFSVQRGAFKFSRLSNECQKIRQPFLNSDYMYIKSFFETLKCRTRCFFCLIWGCLHTNIFSQLIKLHQRFSDLTINFLKKWQPFFFLQAPNVKFKFKTEEDGRFQLKSVSKIDEDFFKF